MHFDQALCFGITERFASAEPPSQAIALVSQRGKPRHSSLSNISRDTQGLLQKLLSAGGCRSEGRRNHKHRFRWPLGLFSFSSSLLGAQAPLPALVKSYDKITGQGAGAVEAGCPGDLSSYCWGSAKEMQATASCKNIHEGHCCMLKGRAAPSPVSWLNFCSFRYF